VTTRGARDGDARGDGDPRGDDRDAGDTNDELAGEDAQVRAMRSVWLAMREEEPSSGGLAELMAAARGKAAEMAPAPSWWQRAVAGLRRPQVLAFATVLVLLGGALVVSRQVEREGAPLAAGSARGRAQSEVVNGAVPTGAAPPPAHGEGVLEQTRAAPPRTDDDSSGPAAVAEKQRVIATDDAPRSPPAVVAPSRPAPKLARKPAMTDELGRETDSPADAPAATISAGAASAPPSAGTISAGAASAPPSEAAKGAAPAGADTAKRVRVEPAPGPELAKPAPAPVARDERKPEGPGPAVHTKPPARRATPPALYRQCEAAATRGDCVEVRRLVDQISTTDRQYRAKAAKAPPTAKCLAE